MSSNMLHLSVIKLIFVKIVREPFEFNKTDENYHKTVSLFLLQVFVYLGKRLH